MLELNSELREIYLEPGELHIAREPATFGRRWARRSASRSGARSCVSARSATRC
jgi:hypothetical protein